MTASPSAPLSWRTCVAAAAVAACLLASPVSAAAPPQEHQAPAASAQSPAEPGHQGQPPEPATPVAGESRVPHEGAAAHEGQGHEGEAHEAESPWALIGRILNFAILAGSLVYLLRSPALAYLAARAKTIRADLSNAEETRRAAAAQLADIEARMKALPGEIESMVERGKREIAAEDARIREAAVAERERMLEQARREIALQVRAAERMLRRRAGELAVNVASERVKRAITPDDHARLVDRYLENVGGGEMTI